MRSLHSSLLPIFLRRSAVCAVCLLSLLLIAPPLFADEDPAPVDISSSEMNAVHDGEVHVELDRAGSVNRGVVIGIIQKKVNDVIPLVARCWEYGDWRESLTDTALKGRDGDDVVICSGTANVPFPARDRHGHFRVHNDVTTIDGTQSFVSTFQYIDDSGNMEDMFGYWVLQPYGEDGEHTLLKHVLNVDIGGWLPDALVRWATGRTLPDTVLGIRDQLNDDGLSEPLFWRDHDYD